MHRTARRTRGFTLIELVITVAIVGVLASLAVPLVELGVKRQREAELRDGLRQIRQALDAYRQAVDEGKVAAGANDSGYPRSLQLLVDGVENIQDPKRRKLYFLRRIPRDPLAAGPAADGASAWGERSYASPAEEPQAGEDVFDVFTRSRGVGLNGIPYRQW